MQKSTIGNKPSILIIAAETSSTLYAQRLLEHWRDIDLEVDAFGVGSQEMEDFGFERLGRSEEMAVVGLQEVIKHYGLISAVFKKVCAEVEKRKPNVILLLDYPGFNLRLAKKLRPLGIPIVYYISPQVWAWKKGRVFEIKKNVDKMLVLFDFEEKFYQDYDIDCEFVGHPLLDEISEDHFEPGKIKEARQRFAVADDDILLGLMPGSRHSELGYHLETQLRAAERLAITHPQVKVALLVAPEFDISELRSRLPRLDIPLITMKDEPLNMIRICDLILCASGTATLFVGLMEKPMVIMYKMNPITAWLAKRLVNTTPYFGMINLIHQKEAVPERFQEAASVDGLVKELQRFVEDKEYYRSTVEIMKTTKEKLGNRGATLRVTEVLKKYLE